MKYSLLTEPPSKEQLIQRVFKVKDGQNRVRIKWDVSIEDDNDLIIVIRSKIQNFSLSSVIETDKMPQDTTIFVYSKKETLYHTEIDRNNGEYSYYVFIGKLLDEGKIGICDQEDGNNLVTGISTVHSSSDYVQPEGRLYYQYRSLNYIASYLCSIAISWIIYSIVVNLPLQILERYPRIDYMYFALAITGSYIICYWIFPSGNWSKRACLHIIRKSKYEDKDKLHYTVSGCKAKYSVRLTDVSNDIIIPVEKGERVSFNMQEIQITELSYFNYLYWMFIKQEKG